MSRFRSRFTYSNLVASLALFVALGGGAYAATSLPANSVGTRQLRNHSVTPPKLSPRTTALLKGGPRGAAGPSDIYAAGTAAKPLTGSYTSLGNVIVPSGSYLLEGQVEASSSGASHIACLLGANATSGPVWDGNSIQHTDASEDVASLSGVATFTKPQVVQLLCRVLSGTVNAGEARVVAIKTGALHGTTPVD